MLARASLSIDIIPYALPMPLIGCSVTMLPIWIDLPLSAATLVGFAIAFKVRMRLTRRPAQA